MTFLFFQRSGLPRSNEATIGSLCRVFVSSCVRGRTLRKLSKIWNRQLQEQRNRPEPRRHERVRRELGTLRAVAADVDPPGRSRVDGLDRVEDDLPGGS